MRRTRLGLRYRSCGPVRRDAVDRRGRDPHPGFQGRRLVGPSVRGIGPVPRGPADRGLHEAPARGFPLRRGQEGPRRRDQYDLHGPGPQGPSVTPVEGPGVLAAAHAGLRRSARDLPDLPRVRGDPLVRGGAHLENRGDVHRGRLGDAGERPRELGRFARHPRGRPAPRAPLHGPGRDGDDRARLSQPLALDRVPVRRGIPARPTRPPDGLVPVRPHLRLRRADHRPSSP